MSISLTTASPLTNASIQYTYPEMDIRGIQTVGNTSVKKFFFRNGLSSSSFSFTDSENSIYKSGIASEGIISTGKHGNNTHELTIKHITTAGDFFYIVFPISNDGPSSFINEIINNSDDINVINMNVENKSLNTMISASKVYKYTNNNEKQVFVFEAPIKIANSLDNIKDSHSEWSSVSETSPTINMIELGSSEKVTEEIVCDSTGDTEQTINNEPLIRGATKIGWTTLFFMLFAIWIGYFYSIPIINKEIVSGITNDGWFIILYMAAFIPLIMIVFSYGLNINWGRLSTYRNPAISLLLFIILLWPIDFVFRIFVYGFLSLLNSVINFSADLSIINVFDFAKGYLNSSTAVAGAAAAANANTSAMLTIFVLFAVWLVAIFAIVLK